MRTYGKAQAERAQTILFIDNTVHMNIVPESRLPAVFELVPLPTWAHPGSALALSTQWLLRPYVVPVLCLLSKPITKSYAQTGK